MTPKTTQPINSLLADKNFFMRPSGDFCAIYKIILHAYAILNQYEASFTFTSSVSDFLVFSPIDLRFGQFDF